MKTAIIAGLTVAGLLLPVAAHAQEVTVIARDFVADGKILELDLPESADGTRLAIVWEGPGGQHFDVRVARGGRHAYEMRHLPNWRGLISALAVGPGAGSGGPREPTLLDEVDMFLQPERMTPSTINRLDGHTLFGWSWDRYVLIVFLISALGFALIARKRFVPAFVLGFAVAWALMDVRAIYDRAFIIYAAERYDPTAGLLTAAEVFAERAAEAIGAASWGNEVNEPLVGAYFRYRLSEHEYLPSDSELAPAFAITLSPDGREVVVEHGRYYLVQIDPR